MRAIKQFLVLGLLFVCFSVSGRAYSCPTVDDTGSFLKFRTNFLYDYTESFRDDFHVEFNLWVAEQSQNCNYELFDIYEDWMANIFLSYGIQGEEGMYWGRCIADWSSSGHPSFSVEFNSQWEGVYAGGDPSSVPPGQICARALLAHEIGHGFGAGHSTDVTSCSDFMNSSEEYQYANLPTMVVGSQASTWNWGLFYPYPVLYDLAPADVAWARNLNCDNVPVGVQTSTISTAIQNGEVVITWPNSSEFENWVFEVRAIWGNQYEDIPATLIGDKWQAVHDVSHFSSGEEIKYELRGGRFDGVLVTVSEENVVLPGVFFVGKIESAYPNPFNPAINIDITCPVGKTIELSIFDIKGNCVRHLFSGTNDNVNNTMIWRGDTDAGYRAPSGVYFVHLFSENMVDYKKIVLLK